MSEGARSPSTRTNLIVEVDGRPRRLTDPHARALELTPLITPMPLGPAALAGLTQLDGEVLPVFWPGKSQVATLAVLVTTALGRCVVLCGRTLTQDGEPLDVEALLESVRHEVRG